MRVFQILLLTVGLIFGGILLSRVSVRVSAQNNSNVNVSANRYSNTAGNSYSGNWATNNYPKNNVKRISKDEDYDLNTDEPTVLKRIAKVRTYKFPINGQVRVQVIEEIDQPIMLKFIQARTEKSLGNFVLQNKGGDYRKTDFNSLIEPFVTLRLINIEGIPSPLIHLVLTRPGGSDHSFWSMLFGEINGKIRLLTPPTTSNAIQGGIHIGQLGKGNGVGLAVWNFVWDNNEAHYDSHRYWVEFFPYNKKLGKFVKSKEVFSKKKYDHYSKALEELGLSSFENALKSFPELKDYREEEEN